MKWLAVLWLALWLAPAWAQEPAGACTAQVLSIQVAQGGNDGRRPDSVQWQTVALPDDWSARWPGYSGTAWYRIGWRRDCAGAADGQVALALESVVMAGEVYINDERIWSDPQLTEPLSRSWNMPRYWLIPDALLHPGENTLWIRVVGVAGQSPGLGPVYLGGKAPVLQRYEDLWWRHRTLFTLNLIVSAVLGGLCFCIWLMRREQRAFGWYALMALFWVLFIANVLVTSPWPFPDSLTAARANIMVLVLYVACFCVFTWRFGGQSLPRIEKALWLLAAALLATLAFVPQIHLAEVQLGVVLIVSAIFFANCLQFPLHALRTRRPEHAMLAVCLLVFVAACAHDLLRVLKLIDGENIYTPFTSVVVTLCMSAVLGLRHARNVRRIERFNQELADGIEQARTELATTLEREHALALTNARLQDRLQIAHDLHDGLGGSLVRMMAMVEQASAPLHSQQFLSMLKLLRDDLRQTIDSGSSAGVTVPATPREWIAPLRHRFMQLFDELDISANWRVPEQWRAPPSALQCMALTRLVEESLVNVLKHSRARRVEVELRQPEPDRLELRIEDDGVGFDVAAVLRAGISVGMRSMHTRIARVGGTLEVASRPGQTMLTATLGPRAPQT
ncbi:periplasmic sensor signal transduction histidine kinase 3 [Achromobacter xylosoxidans A8]|uniref:Periplasmic sensor signal transduction histidine kinase 3 n=1 Tax=Achromobacter xylosoxidans (strain A8) TaxID=762376 RepID=E3HKM6_ACHXA|nr:periplasmic sensor signal transduction histidine kinase 3 [Achromobacter xylosoxidans A8]